MNGKWLFLLCPTRHFLPFPQWRLLSSGCRKMKHTSTWYYLQEKGNLSPSSMTLGWTSESSMLVNVFADFSNSSSYQWWCKIQYWFIVFWGFVIFRLAFLDFLVIIRKNNPNARQLTHNRFDSEASVLHSTLSRSVIACISRCRQSFTRIEIQFAKERL